MNRIKFFLLFFLIITFNFTCFALPSEANSLFAFERQTHTGTLIGGGTSFSTFIDNSQILVKSSVGSQILRHNFGSYSAIASSSSGYISWLISYDSNTNSFVTTAISREGYIVEKTISRSLSYIADTSNLKGVTRSACASNNGLLASGQVCVNIAHIWDGSFNVFLTNVCEVVLLTSTSYTNSFSCSETVMSDTDLTDGNWILSDISIFSSSWILPTLSSDPFVVNFRVFGFLPSNYSKISKSYSITTSFSAASGTPVVALDNTSTGFTTVAYGRIFAISAHSKIVDINLSSDAFFGFDLDVGVSRLEVTTSSLKLTIRTSNIVTKSWSSNPLGSFSPSDWENLVVAVRALRATNDAVATLNQFRGFITQPGSSIFGFLIDSTNGDFIASADTRNGCDSTAWSTAAGNFNFNNINQRVTSPQIIRMTEFFVTFIPYAGFVTEICLTSNESPVLTFSDAATPFLCSSSTSFSTIVNQLNSLPSPSLLYNDDSNSYIGNPSPMVPLLYRYANFESGWDVYVGQCIEFDQSSLGLSNARMYWSESSLLSPTASLPNDYDFYSVFVGFNSISTSSLYISSMYTSDTSIISGAMTSLTCASDIPFFGKRRSSADSLIADVPLSTATSQVSPQVQDSMYSNVDLSIDRRYFLKIDDCSDDIFYISSYLDRLGNVPASCMPTVSSGTKNLNLIYYFDEVLPISDTSSDIPGSLRIPTSGSCTFKVATCGDAEFSNGVDACVTELMVCINKKVLMVDSALEMLSVDVIFDSSSLTDLQHFLTTITLDGASFYTYSNPIVQPTSSDFSGLIAGSTYTFIATAADPNGYEQTCSADVEVVSALPIFVTCPLSIVDVDAGVPVTTSLFASQVTAFSHFDIDVIQAAASAIVGNPTGTADLLDQTADILTLSSGTSATIYIKAMDKAHQLKDCQFTVRATRTTCPAGSVGDGTTCLPDTSLPAGVDECVAGTHSCSTDATCADISTGGYSCTCDSAYYGDGFLCSPRMTATAISELEELSIFSQENDLQASPDSLNGLSTLITSLISIIQIEQSSSTTENDSIFSQAFAYITTIIESFERNSDYVTAQVASSSTTLAALTLVSSVSSMSQVMTTTDGSLPSSTILEAATFAQLMDGGVTSASTVSSTISSILTDISALSQRSSIVSSASIQCEETIEVLSTIVLNASDMTTVSSQSSITSSDSSLSISVMTLDPSIPAPSAALSDYESGSAGTVAEISSSIPGSNQFVGIPAVSSMNLPSGSDCQPAISVIEWGTNALAKAQSTSSLDSDTLTSVSVYSKSCTVSSGSNAFVKQTLSNLNSNFVIGISTSYTPSDSDSVIRINDNNWIDGLDLDTAFSTFIPIGGYQAENGTVYYGNGTVYVHDGNIATRTSLCGWFNEATLTWSVEGCSTNVRKGSGGDILMLCECNHLTSFGRMIIEVITSSNLNLLGNLGSLRFTWNNIMFWCVIVIFLLWLLQILAARYMDLKYPITDEILAQFHLNDFAVIARLHTEAFKQEFDIRKKNRKILEEKRKAIQTLQGKKQQNWFATVGTAFVAYFKRLHDRWRCKEVSTAVDDLRTIRNVISKSNSFSSEASTAASSYISNFSKYKSRRKDIVAAKLADIASINKPDTHTNELLSAKKKVRNTSYKMDLKSNSKKSSACHNLKESRSMSTKFEEEDIYDDYGSPMVTVNVMDGDGDIDSSVSSTADLESSTSNLSIGFVAEVENAKEGRKQNSNESVIENLARIVRELKKVQPDLGWSDCLHTAITEVRRSHKIRLMWAADVISAWWLQKMANKFNMSLEEYMNLSNGSDGQLGREKDFELVPLTVRYVAKDYPSDYDGDSILDSSSDGRSFNPVSKHSFNGSSSNFETDNDYDSVSVSDGMNSASHSNSEHNKIIINPIDMNNRRRHMGSRPDRHLEEVASDLNANGSQNTETPGKSASFTKVVEQGLFSSPKNLDLHQKNVNNNKEKEELADLFFASDLRAISCNIMSPSEMKDLTTNKHDDDDAMLHLESYIQPNEFPTIDELNGDADDNEGNDSRPPHSYSLSGGALMRDVSIAPTMYPIPVNIEDGTGKTSAYGFPVNNNQKTKKNIKKHNNNDDSSSDHHGNKKKSPFKNKASRLVQHIAPRPEVDRHMLENWLTKPYVATAMANANKKSNLDSKNNASTDVSSPVTRCQTLNESKCAKNKKGTSSRDRSSKKNEKSKTKPMPRIREVSALQMSESSVEVMSSRLKFVEWAPFQLLKKIWFRDHPLAAPLSPWHKRTCVERSILFGSSIFATLFIVGLYYGVSDPNPENDKMIIDFGFQVSGIQIELTLKDLIASCFGIIVAGTIPISLDRFFYLKTPLIERLIPIRFFLTVSLRSQDGALSTRLMTNEEKTTWIRNMRRNRLIGHILGISFCVFVLFFLAIVSMGLNSDLSENLQLRRMARFGVSSVFSVTSKYFIVPTILSIIITLIIKVALSSHSADGVINVFPSITDFSADFIQRNVNSVQRSSNISIRSVSSFGDLRDSASLPSQRKRLEYRLFKERKFKNVSEARKLYLSNDDSILGFNSLTSRDDIAKNESDESDNDIEDNIDNLEWDGYLPRMAKDALERQARAEERSEGAGNSDINYFDLHELSPMSIPSMGPINASLSSKHK